MSSDTWISGTVVHGNGFGKKLGFPTANLQLDENTARPAEGIYACWVMLGAAHEDGRASPTKWAGALHVGPRPAIHDETPTVEVHILDFNGRDLYGQQVSLQLVKRLRDVENFDSMEELREAIAEDCLLVRRTILDTAI